jgi:ribosome assembly protein YihI (activator of Der GTPase)
MGSYQRSDISDQEGRGKVINYQFSVVSNERKRESPDRVGVNADAENSEGRRERQRKGLRRGHRERRAHREEGFLSTRPDTPDCGAKEKIGPLRSE